MKKKMHFQSSMPMNCSPLSTLTSRPMLNVSRPLHVVVGKFSGGARSRLDAEHPIIKTRTLRCIISIIVFVRVPKNFLVSLETSVCAVRAKFARLVCEVLKFLMLRWKTNLFMFWNWLKSVLTLEIRDKKNL